MVNEGLKGLLEEVKHLKTDLGVPVTTQNALGYIRSQQAYERLRDQVNERLKGEGLKFNHGLRQLANLCNAISLRATYALRFECLDAWAVDKKPSLNPKNPTVQDYLTRNGTKDRYDDGSFGFDYELFLANYTRSFSAGDDPKEAFRQAFLEFYLGDTPFLKDKKGEKISVKQFRLDPSKTLDYYEISGEMFGDLEMEMQDLENFKEWIKFGSSDNFITRFNLESTTHEEMDLFYLSHDSKDAYRRAIEEKTLGRIETERQIALSWLIGKFEGKSVNEGIKGLDGLLKGRKKRLVTLKEMCLPDHPILLNENRMVEEARYVLIAVKKNKKWLEQVLGN